MRDILKPMAVLAGLAVPTLLFTPPATAADLEPIVEEPAEPGWYFSVFAGRKWADEEVDLSWKRESPCPYFLCSIIDHEGELHGEIDDGWIFGATLGTQITEHLRAELEVSHARLDTESIARERAISIYYPGEYEAEDDDELRELFILANLWFGFPVGLFSPYFGGGVGVAHVDSEFGVDNLDVGTVSTDVVSVSLEADEWNFAFQLGAGVLIGLTDNIGIDVGYRFKAIPNIDFDDVKFCLHSDCHTDVEFKSKNDGFDLHQHVVQIGLVIAF